MAAQRKSPPPNQLTGTGSVDGRPPKSARSADNRQPKISVDERRRRYVNKVLEDELDALSATSGSRNAALFAATSRLAEFVGIGLLDEDVVAGGLRAACETNGYSRADGRRAVESTIRSGLKAGKKNIPVIPIEAADCERQPVARKKCAWLTPQLPMDEDLAYPDEAAEEFWRSCAPVTSSVEVVAAMITRRIDPQAVEDYDLARVIPDGDLPRWAAYRYASWRQTRHLWVVPMFDCTGRLRSVRARRVGGEGGDAPKSLPPTGYSVKGLVFACPLGRQILSAAGAGPEWWEGGELRIEVCEGEKKWLQRVVSLNQDAEDSPAVLGVVAGSWHVGIANRLPSGTSLFICTDPNTAGARYATTIVRSLATRIVSGDISIRLRDEFVLRAANGQLAVEVRS